MKKEKETTTPSKIKPARLALANARHATSDFTVQGSRCASILRRQLSATGYQRLVVVNRVTTVFFGYPLDKKRLKLFTRVDAFED